MDELIAFLRARLDEQESDAQADLADELSIGAHYVDEDLARWLLRDVEAKRRIVERYEHKQRSMSEHPNQGNANALAAMTETLCDLVSVWSDHPDWREEWRP